MFFLLKKFAKMKNKICIWFILIVYVYKSSGEDMMTNILKLNENEKFPSSEQLAERINRVLYFATRDSCDFYRTFFDGNYNFFYTDNHSIHYFYFTSLFLFFKLYWTDVTPNIMVSATNSYYERSKEDTRTVKDALVVTKILIKTACANIDLINGKIKCFLIFQFRSNYWFFFRL